jgi:hypothetical protein
MSSFIEIASIVVDRVVDCASSDDARTTLSDAEAEAVERYLAAHFWAVDDQQYTSKKTERAEAQFAGKWDEGFKATTFGQQAIAIDPSGCLDDMNIRKQKVGLSWLGLAPSGQTDYVDRD